MQPPFFDTKILDALTLDDVVPLIDREILFAARWQYRQGMDAERWEALKAERAIPTFERLLALCRARGIIVPRIVYGYFRCLPQGNALVVEGERRPQRFEFPRERAAPNRCLADFFPDGFIAILLATVGDGPTREGAKLFSAHAYSDTFFLKGLAGEAAEATAELGHRHIRRELGVPEGVGARFSPGYPSFPSLFDQRKIVALLGAGRLGVKLTRTCQLVPEHTATAVISVDPKAVSFRP